jgi:hypothetical protein
MHQTILKGYTTDLRMSEVDSICLIVATNLRICKVQSVERWVVGGQTLCRQLLGEGFDRIPIADENHLLN